MRGVFWVDKAGGSDFSCLDASRRRACVQWIGISFLVGPVSVLPIHLFFSKLVLQVDVMEGMGSDI